MATTVARWLWRHKRTIATGTVVAAGAYGAYVVWRKKRELEELLEPATSKRLTLAKALVGRVTHAEAVKASRPIGYLRKFCVALGMQHEIAEHIRKEAEVNGAAMPRIFGPDADDLDSRLAFH